MNAPDKIYLPHHNIEAGTISELAEYIVDGSIEYIRKEAILEWLEEELRNGGPTTLVQHIINRIKTL